VEQKTEREGWSGNRRWQLAEVLVVAASAAARLGAFAVGAGSPASL
jgi:hypothetical protein